MQTAQINSPRFNLQTMAPLGGTLDDFRVIHDNYSSAGAFSAKAMRPILIAAAVIAAGAGIAFGANMYLDRGTVKLSAPVPASAPDTSVPFAAPAIQHLQAPAIAPAAKDTLATEPLVAPAKAEALTSVPMAGHGNNHSSESMNPAKAKSSIAAKPAPVAARKVAPPVETLNVISASPPEVAPAPAPVIIDVPAVVPTPTPSPPPVEPLPQ